MASNKDLIAWEKIVDLAVECYALAKQFPKEELFALSLQIRRVASSIPANVAEGWGRESSKLLRAPALCTTKVSAMKPRFRNFTTSRLRPS
jgi:hypothetical protein